jgi:5-hydroxyisourate hydrolase
MSTISTHVLDTSLGKPASGVSVTLERDGAVVGSGTTDRDGRVKEVLKAGQQLASGTYDLTFSVAEYFTRTGREAFYDRIVISFQVRSESDHYHVPLLLSPFGYSTYRGS